MAPDTDSWARERAEKAMEAAHVAATAAQAAAAAASLASAAIAGHELRCEEREKRHDQQHTAFQEQMRETAVRNEQTIERIEHDGRNMRQEAIAAHGDYKRTVERELESIKHEASIEREKINKRISGIQAVLWGGMVSLVLLQLGIIAYFLTRFGLPGAGH